MVPWTCRVYTIHIHTIAALRSSSTGNLKQCQPHQRVGFCINFEGVPLMLSCLRQPLRTNKTICLEARTRTSVTAAKSAAPCEFHRGFLQDTTTLSGMFNSFQFQTMHSILLISAPQDPHILGRVQRIKLKFGTQARAFWGPDHFRTLTT